MAKGAPDSTERHLDSRLTTLFHLALYRWNIKLTCRKCGYSRIFQGHQLWWLYHKRNYDGRTAVFWKRFYCTSCLYSVYRRVKDVRWEKTKEEPTGWALPWPEEREWKRMVRRYRS